MHTLMNSQETFKWACEDHSSAASRIHYREYFFENCICIYLALFSFHIFFTLFMPENTNVLKQ